MSSPASILVCRLSALGDVVLSLPVVQALRERYPRCRLAFLSREPFGRILRGVAWLDHLYLWEGRGRRLPASLEASAWDLLVDLSGTGRSRALLRRVRAGRRLRVHKEWCRRFAFVHLRFLTGGSARPRPVLDRMFSALAPLGIRREGRLPRFDVGPPPEEGPVLLAPGAARATKCWPVRRFVEVARALAQRGERALLVGSVGERELLEEVGRPFAVGRCEILAGCDPGDLPEQLARCPVGLTNDSGIFHAAQACGVRVVAVFGPTHPGLGFGPWRAGSLAVHAGLPCSPCDLHGPARCPRGHHRCMRGIPAQRVLGALLERLRSEGESS